MLKQVDEGLEVFRPSSSDLSRIRDRDLKNPSKSIRLRTGDMLVPEHKESQVFPKYPSQPLTTNMTSFSPRPYGILSQ